MRSGCRTWCCAYAAATQTRARDMLNPPSGMYTGMEPVCAQAGGPGDVLSAVVGTSEYVEVGGRVLCVCACVRSRGCVCVRVRVRVRVHV